jgi:hypothetical protein
MGSAQSKTIASHAGWLPSQPHIIHDYLKVQHERITARIERGTAYEPAIARFAAAIQDDEEVKALLDQAFLQADPVAGVPKVTTS